MGYVYAIANQKGGVGKTTTTVNLAACIADAGSQTLVVDLDPQCNATVALGLDRELRPSSYDCLCGEVSVAEAARPAGPDNLWVVPANRDLAGAAVELPRLEGSETGCATASARSASASPPRSSTARPRWGRSPSTRWPLPTASSCRSRPSIWRSRGWSSSSTPWHDPPRTEPVAGSVGPVITMHDERTRLSQDVEHELSDHFTDMVFETVIPRSVRLAEAPSYGLPVIAHAPVLARRRRLPRPGRGGARPWLGSRGWAGAWRRSCPESDGASRRAARRAGRADQAEPEPAAQVLRRRLARRASPSRSRERRRPAARRPPAQRRPLRADRRRASLARRPAGRPGDGAGHPPHRAEQSACRWRWSRTWCARTSTRSRRREPARRWSTGSTSARRRSPAASAAAARPISNLIRLLDLPDQALEMLEAGELSEGHGRALLARRGQGRAPPPRPRGRRRGAGRSARRRAGRSG